MKKIEEEVFDTLMNEKTDGEKSNEDLKVSFVKSLMSGLGVEMKKDIDELNTKPKKKKSFLERLFKVCK